MMEGFVLVDKPPGHSSFGVVKKIRHLSGVKKVGHCGTLDPFATGLLIIAIGRQFTRQIDNFQGMIKTYEVEAELGYETSTLDPEGDVLYQTENPIEVTEQALLTLLESFKGPITQDPPIFSAKKIAGQPAYKLARKGKDVALEPCHVTIHELDLLSFDAQAEVPRFKLRVVCSKGTYIRALVRDIGRALSCYANAVALRRTAIGSYQVDDAIIFDDLSQESLSQYSMAHG